MLCWRHALIRGNHDQQDKNRSFHGKISLGEIEAATELLLDDCAAGSHGLETGSVSAWQLLAKVHEIGAEYPTLGYLLLCSRMYTLMATPTMGRP